MPFAFIKRLWAQLSDFVNDTDSAEEAENTLPANSGMPMPKTAKKRKNKIEQRDKALGTGASVAEAPAETKKKRRPRRRKPKSSAAAKAADPGQSKPAAPQSEPVANWGRRENVPSMEGWTVPPRPQLPDDVKAFQDLPLDPRLLRALLDDLQFQACTPIQASSLSHLLNGDDLAGQAQTGTGKTAAFLITVLQHFLTRPLPERDPWQPMAIVLAPTRELALQIAHDAVALSKYCQFSTVAVYGGMDYDRQRSLLAGGVDLVVATPGRLIDFLRQRAVDLSAVEILVIDEADRMLDMGFIPDVKRIIGYLPPAEKRQSMLFSATLSKEIMSLAARWMRAEPKVVEVEPENIVAEGIEEVVYSVSTREKLPILLWTLSHENCRRVLIFRNRRRDVEDLYEQLKRCGVPCEMLSGDVEQKKRLRLLESFRNGATRVIVATDVAGRGIHVDEVTHVINYDLPYEAEDYVHRIGRTARAGQTGRAISFACEEGAFVIPDIEKYIDRELSITQPQPEMVRMPDNVEMPATGRAARSGRTSSSGSRSRPYRSGDRRPSDGRVRRGGPRR